MPRIKYGVWSLDILSILIPAVLDRHTLLWYPCFRAGPDSFPDPKEDVAMDKADIEASVLHAFEVSLEAQLKAVRRLRTGQVEEKKPALRGKSQIDMVYDI